jgi:integrase
MHSIIASRSRTEWILRNNGLYREAETKIKWNTFLPKCEGGTQHQRYYMTCGAQDLLLAIFNEEFSPRKTGYSPGTVFLCFMRLQTLSRWMAKQEIWGFNKLTPVDIIEFLKTRRGKSGHAINEKTLDAWIQLFKKMWQLRSTYRGSIRIDVTSIEDEIKRTIAQSRRTPWKGFSEATAMGIVKDALHWMETYGEFLINTTQRAWVDFDKVVGITSRQRAIMRQRFYRQLESEPLLGNIRRDLGEPSLTTHKVLSRAVTTLEGAAISLILILVGLRISELASLNVDCVTEKKVDGDILPFINGIAAKKGGLPRHWVASEPVPTAINFLVAFNEKIRTASKTNALFVNRPPGSPISLPARRVSRCTTDQLANRMKAFVTAPFRADRPTRCHPHMARKTFAKLAVKRDRRGLEPVAHHLGHVFQWFTDGAYVGFDHELMELMELENRKELAAALTDLLTKPAAGKGGASLKALRFKGKKGLTSLVDTLITKGVQVAPCNWGYCIYNASLSACRGSEKGPNELNRSPEVCSSCSNFSVTDKHREWWNERAKRELNFLTQNRGTAQAMQFVKKRLETSNRILQEISSSQKPATQSSSNQEDH